jgi:hypothetical protein
MKDVFDDVIAERDALKEQVATLTAALETYRREHVGCRIRVSRAGKEYSTRCNMCEKADVALAAVRGERT